MGYIVPGICQRRKVGSPTQKAVLMALASYAWDDGSNVWVSKMTLAADLELARRTIQDAVAALIDKGLLTEVDATSKGRGYTIEYRINLEAVEALPLTREPRNMAARKARESRTTPSESVHLTADKCASDDTEVCSSRTQVSNKYINKNTGERARKADTPVDQVQAVDHTELQKSEVRALNLKKIAEKLNSGGYVPQSAVSVGLAAELISSGFVTQETMKLHGFVF